MSKTRFDLEAGIQDCWGVVDTLKQTLEVVEKIEDPKVADEVSNLLLGIISVYSMKFEQTFNTFEMLIREKRI